MLASRGLVAVLVGVLVLAVACGDEELPRPTPAAADAASVLRQAQDALDRAGSYTLAVQQANFVLPQWGGADGGEVQVAAGGRAALAVLARTGEPGATYTVALRDGQTTFRRSTCDTTFRVPGGGADVLRPFLFGVTKALAGATGAAFSPGATTSVRADVEGLGPVVVDVDLESGRPLRVTGESNGRPLVWTFGDWGRPVDVPAPPAGIEDRGPGGIPC